MRKLLDSIHAQGCIPLSTVLSYTAHILLSNIRQVLNIPFLPPLFFYLYSHSRKRALETLVSETGEGAFLIGVGLDVGSRLLLTTAGLLDYLRIREVRLAYLILP